ncbi:hypothetical protein GGR28_003172 [Lewinella aquimaris]|uniref:Uncharacterized protein n=1 Tax=Neolewinella aquimaris TaxID=1835722 RepID=A0A840EF23_9BACT|nr:hypothetical protein [Neolewinella aquimaris]MBB4080538.1 hypothetical protein [Neolewinella aquimaris]
MDETTKEMKSQLKILEDRIDKIYNIFWVVAVVAGVFGISTATFSYLIGEANKRISSLESEIDQSEQKLASYRMSQEKEFDKYISSQKDSIVIKNELRNAANILNNRISGIRLSAEDAGTAEYSCGEQHLRTPTSLTVMYGLRDGTSCDIRNINYYKRLLLHIPR